MPNRIRKKSSGSFYEERGKLAPFAVINSEQTQKEISISTTVQSNQTSFASLNAHLLPRSENHLLFLLPGTLFLVPFDRLIPTHPEGSSQVLNLCLNLAVVQRSKGAKKQRYRNTFRKGRPNINNCDRSYRGNQMQ